MYTNCQWFGHGSKFGRQTVGHFDAHHLVDHDAFAVSTGVLIAETNAVHALFIKCHRKADDDVALFEVVDAGADIKNFATELVTHHGVAMWFEHDGRAGVRALTFSHFGRQASTFFAVYEHVQITSADATSQYFGENLSATHDGFGNVVNSQGPISHYGSTHT